MSLFDLINGSICSITGIIKITVYIYNSEKTHTELKETAKLMTADLNVVKAALEQLRRFAHRVTVNDETHLIQSINSLTPVISDAHTVIKEVQRDRNFMGRLLMKKTEYRRQLHDIGQRLHNLCKTILDTVSATTQIQIPRREFSDFRRTFQATPEKELSFYDFSIIKDTPQTILTITFDQFDSTRSLCYMKASNEQLFLSYQLRTWSALNPKEIVREARNRRFAQEWLTRSVSNLTSSNSSHDSRSSTPSQPPPPAKVAAANTVHEKLDFSQFNMSHDDICGMTVTRSFIYIATKSTITIVSLHTQKIVAQYGVEGDGPNSFRDISYIYIPPNDETNLYIVDRGQHAVQQYKIDDSDLRFEYVRQYVVIANVNQQCNLISCVIYNRNLYVSDYANNCLHVFPLNGDRQSFYLTDNLITPFSPRSLCAHGDYLYVASCPLTSPGIVVLNEECQPVAWFRNPLLQEILAIHIDPNNELYVLTTQTVNENGKQQKRPLIVSMVSVIPT